MQQQIRPINEQFSICEHKLLGKGSTGNVFLGFRNNDPSSKVAIKSIDLSTINNEVTRYLLSCEIAALSNLGKVQNSGHDNIVRLLDIVIEKNHLYMVMQLLEGGTLADYIKLHPNGLPEEEAIHIFRQILEGYSKIKTKKIVHRDLKPDNILFKKSPKQSKQVAIIDFGYCEMEQVPNKPQMFYNVGSPKYMSPEAYKNNIYSQKSDIWAIGVMLYEMLVGSTVDKGMTMDTYLDMLQKRGVPLPQKLRMFHQHLISSMLAYNHQQRAGIDHIMRQIHLNHPPHELSMEKQRSQAQLRTTLQNEPSQAKARQVMFHSVVLPHERQVARERQMNEKILRSQSKIEPNQNRQQHRQMERIEHIQGPRVNGFSFHVQQNVRPQENQEILGRVQNVELNSARQLVHRRPVQQGHHLNEEVKNPQEQHPTLPKNATMSNLSTTPMTQSNTFSPSPFFGGVNRQMTPMGAQQQHFHIPNTQNPQTAKSSHIFVHPQENHGIHPHKNFFNHGPPHPNPNSNSNSNNGPGSIRIIQPTSPANFNPQPQPMERIVERTERNESTRIQGPQGNPVSQQGPQMHQGFVENRQTVKELSPSKFRVTLNGPMQKAVPRFSYQSERGRQSPFKNAPEHFFPEQRRQESNRVNTFQHFQPVPQVLNLRVNSDNRQNFTRLMPQNARQPEYRSIVPQTQMRMIRQTIVK